MDIIKIKNKDMSYLKEKEKGSSTRLIFVFGSFWAMALCTLFAFKDVEPLTILAVFSGLEGTLIGLKLGQKHQEGKVV